MAEAPDALPARRPGQRWLAGAGLAVVAVIVLAFAALAWIGTDSGRRFVATRVENLAFDNGMKIGIGRIEGSVLGEMRIRDFTLSDPQGIFLRAPLVALDWRPLAYAGKHLAIRSLIVPQARLMRRPAFRPTPPSDAPLLPDLDIDIDRLAVERLLVDPAVTGQRHLVSLAGTAHIAHGRAQLTADARAVAAPGLAGGDRLALRLDASPSANRLTLDLRLDAPAQGLVAGFAGVDRPLRLAVTGEGDWKSWNGRLSGHLGDDMLADVALAARNGLVTARGPMRPGLLLAGQGRALLEPQTNLDLAATLGQRRLRLRGGMANASFRLGIDGLVDLADNRMGDLGISFRLIQPGVIARNLAGNDVAMTATLDGPFASPRIRYGLTARTIAFGATRIDGLAVSGSAALADEQWRIPVHGTARRISGVGGNIASLLANVRLDGDLAYASGRLLSDNLRLRSDAIDATAVLVADPGRALYTGALKGRVAGYQVDGVGTFNLRTDMQLKSGSGGSVRLAGTVQARSVRIANDGLRGVLGGNALISANVGYDSNGIATVDRLTVAAPDFSLTDGHGRYGADGAIRFDARARSARYGPLAVNVTGSVDRPVARIAAARPGLGIGAANVIATVRGSNGIYVVLASGETDYGPFRADLAISAGGGPLRVTVRPGSRLAGLGLAGTIAQTGSGPFAGTLNAHGAGIDGQIVLAAAAGSQRVIVSATADHASLPGRAGFSADRAIIHADAILLDQPQITAEFQVAGMRVGAIAIARARADLTYGAGRGEGRLLVEGRSRFPFRVVARAGLAPDLWRIALDSRINGIDVKTRQPLRIRPRRDGYLLEQANLSVDQGTLLLEGRLGAARALRARLSGVNVALLNPFLDGLGLGGTASGSIDFAQASSAAFPTADARLQLDDFTRTSLAAQSEPVDIALVARLGGAGGEANGVVRRRGAAIGRIQVALRPLPAAAGNWTTRLLAAPLAGGVRYNGPADVLFSLAALPDQSLRGPIGVAADFSGRVSAPQLAGVVRANSLVYENGSYGTRLTDLAVTGRFTNDRLQVESLTARAGSGTVRASGFVSLSAAQQFPVQLGIALDNAQLARGQDLAAQASGQLRVVNGPGQPATITGRISLPETRYRIVREGSAKIATLTGVRRKPPVGPEAVSGAPEPTRAAPSSWRLDVDVAADNQIYVSGMGLDSEWAADLHLGGTTGAPVISGNVRVVRGTLGFAGHSFALQQGRIGFTGGSALDPDIDIVATGDVADVAITITITGTGNNPQIAFSSTPSLPQDELMSRILFGNSVGSLSAIQAVQLAASLNSLRGGKGGLNPLGVLQSASGVSRLRVLGADAKTGRGNAVAVGQYITNDIYVEVITDTRGQTATQLEVSLSKALSILSATGSFGGSNVSLRYRKNY